MWAVITLDVIGVKKSASVCRKLADFWAMITLDVIGVKKIASLCRKSADFWAVITLNVICKQKKSFTLNVITFTLTTKI